MASDLQLEQASPLDDTMNEGKQMTTAVIRSDVSDKMMESETFQGSSEIN